MRIKKIAVGVSYSIAACLLVAGTFYSFTVACEVGLHISAQPEMLADVTVWMAGDGTIWAIGAVVVGVAINTLVIYAVMCWRAKRSSSTEWNVAAVLGAIAAVAGAFYALIVCVLLSSATWGNHGVDFFERDQFVEATVPAWLWWLVALLATMIGIVVILGRGPASSPSGKRRYRWPAYVTLGAVPVLIIGALTTTATLAIT